MIISNNARRCTYLEQTPREYNLAVKSEGKPETATRGLCVSFSLLCPSARLMMCYKL